VYCDLKLHSEDKTDDISTINHGMSFKKKIDFPIGRIKTLLLPSSFVLSKQRHRAITFQPEHNSTYYLSQTKICKYSSFSFIPFIFACHDLILSNEHKPKQKAKS